MFQVFAGNVVYETFHVKCATDIDLFFYKYKKYSQMSEVEWQVLRDLSNARTHTLDPDKAPEGEAAAGRLTRTRAGDSTLMLE